MSVHVQIHNRASIYRPNVHISNYKLESVIGNMKIRPINRDIYVYEYPLQTRYKI